VCSVERGKPDSQPGAGWLPGCVVRHDSPAEYELTCHERGVRARSGAKPTRGMASAGSDCLSISAVTSCGAGSEGHGGGDCVGGNAPGLETQRWSDADCYTSKALCYWLYD